MYKKNRKKDAVENEKKILKHLFVDAASVYFELPVASYFSCIICAKKKENCNLIQVKIFFLNFQIIERSSRAHCSSKK